MTILVDTREHPTEYAERRYKSFGVPYRRQKLYAGDYSCEVILQDGRKVSLEDIVCIERKESLTELAMCFSSERKRFRAEFERAHRIGTNMILLVEGGSWEGIYGHKYRTKMSPRSLVASLAAWMARYGCQVVFCKTDTSGMLIKDLLYYAAREFLENIDDILPEEV